MAERLLASLPPRVGRIVTFLRDVHERARAVAVDQLSAGVAYFGFLALIPVLLLATSVAGFLLDDVEAQRTVATAITSALPGLDAAVQPGGALDALLTTLVRRRSQLGLVGAVSLLLVALRLAASLMAGVELAFHAPRTKGVGARLRQLAALGALGVVAVVGFAATGVTSGLLGGLLPFLPGPVLSVATFAVGAVFDVLLFLVAYTVLSPFAWRVHLPGALLGAVGWTALKVFGATYVGIRLQSAGAVYGTLAGVATVLVLLYVMARLFLTGAVLSAVATERSTGTRTGAQTASEAATEEGRR